MTKPLLLAVVLFCALHMQASERSPLTAVDHVDLARYAGKWYEIARLPNRFEKKCDRDVTAEYALAGSAVRVTNRCVRADGSEMAARGKAKVVDGSGNAKLKVTFFWPFYGDYWVIGLAPDYRWAVVGEPGRKYLWILSRSATLSSGDAAEVDKVIERSGYDRSMVVMTRQDPVASR